MFFATTPEGAQQLNPHQNVTLRCEVKLGRFMELEWKGPLLLGQRGAVRKAAAKAAGIDSVLYGSYKVYREGPYAYNLVSDPDIVVTHIHVHSASASDWKHISLNVCNVMGVDVPLCHLRRGFFWLGAFIILLQSAAGVAAVVLKQIRW
jgi:hypothetical protein